MGNDMRVERTRGSLRDALLAIMQEKPWRSVRVAEVARVAGVSRKAFYDHYADLFDLAFDCYDVFCLDYGAGTPISDDESRRRATLNYIEYVSKELEFYRENPNLAHMIYE